MGPKSPTSFLRAVPKGKRLKVGCALANTAVVKLENKYEHNSPVYIDLLDDCVEEVLQPVIVDETNNSNQITERKVRKPGGLVVCVDCNETYKSRGKTAHRAICKGQKTIAGLSEDASANEVPIIAIAYKKNQSFTDMPRVRIVITKTIEDMYTIGSIVQAVKIFPVFDDCNLNDVRVKVNSLTEASTMSDRMFTEQVLRTQPHPITVIVWSTAKETKIQGKDQGKVRPIDRPLGSAAPAYAIEEDFDDTRAQWLGSILERHPQLDEDRYRHLAHQWASRLALGKTAMEMEIIDELPSMYEKKLSKGGLKLQQTSTTPFKSQKEAHNNHKPSVISPGHSPIPIRVAVTHTMKIHFYCARTGVELDEGIGVTCYDMKKESGKEVYWGLVGYDDSQSKVWVKERYLRYHSGHERHQFLDRIPAPPHGVRFSGEETKRHSLSMSALVEC